MRTLIYSALLTGILVSPAWAQTGRYPAPRPRNEPQPVYRYFHPDSRDHLLTATPELEASVVAREYVSEGIVFNVYPRSGAGLIPLYRFFTPSGEHFYTTSRDAAAVPGARFELTLGHIAEEERPGLRPLHVWYNRTADRHFYTTDREGELAPRAGYQYQGILGYVVPARRGE
jgi:Repeat of unknown function (DUF5648)